MAGAVARVVELMHRHAQQREHGETAPFNRVEFEKSTARVW